MKKNRTTLLITVFTLMFTAPNVFAQAHQPVDSILYHAQEKIYHAFYNSFRKGNMNKLVNIEKKLRSISTNSYIPKYWLAYTNFYESIYQLKMGTKEASHKEINEGLEVLQNIKNINSEVHALLSMMQGFAIQFEGGMAVALLAQKAKRNAHKALRLDKTNIRAWYVLALNNYHAPKAFGGGERVESSLKKAISLDKKNKNNPYLPTWGEKQSYRLLIAYYIKNNRCQDAKKVLQEALNKYPNAYRIKRYERTLPDC